MNKIIVILFALLFVAGCTQADLNEEELGARQEGEWEVKGTTHVQPASPSGKSLLIRGSSKYINFNALTGSIGYGFRDNSGTLQWKNSGSDWTEFGTGAEDLSDNELDELQNVASMTEAEGDLFYYLNGSWNKLATGTASQVLKINSSTGYPEWGADAQGGGGFPAQLGQVGDVSTTSLAAWNILYYDGSNWIVTATSTWDDVIDGGNISSNSNISALNITGSGDISGANILTSGSLLATTSTIGTLTLTNVLDNQYLDADLVTWLAASSTLLTITTANDTYSQHAFASSTYLTIATAASTYSGHAYASSSYVHAADWTTIDNYPAECSGGVVFGLGDTLKCVASSSLGASVNWDDIGNPDADDEIDMGAYEIELNTENLRIGDGGTNYLQVLGDGTASTTGNFKVGGTLTLGTVLDNQYLDADLVTWTAASSTLLTITTANDTYSQHAFASSTYQTQAEALVQIVYASSTFALSSSLADLVSYTVASTTYLNQANYFATTSLPSTILTSSLTSVGTLTGGGTGAGFTVNLDSSTLTCTDCIDDTDIDLSSITLADFVNDADYMKWAAASSSDFQTSGNIYATGGTFYGGVDDTTQGQLNLYGNNANTGAKLSLYNSANEDGSIDSWYFSASDYLTLGGGGTFYFDGSSNFYTAGTIYATSSVIDTLTLINVLDNQYLDGDLMTWTAASSSISTTNLTADYASTTGITVTGLLDLDGSATTTADNGIDISTGCFAVGGTCVGGGAGGATAWDDIGNPDADDEIDFGAYEIELNVENMRIGDGGSNYLQILGDGTASTTAEFSALTFQSGSGLKGGTDDVTKGWLYLYGDDDAAGGEIRIFNSANEDGGINYWNMVADGHTFLLGTSVNDSLFAFDSNGNFLTAGTLYATSTIIDNSLEIPQNQTQSAIGQIDFDTTDNQLQIATSTGDDPAIIPTVIKLFGGGLSSTSPDFISGGIIPTSIQRDGFTITEIWCRVDGATSIVINLANSNGEYDTETVTCDVDGASDTDITTNSGWTAATTSPPILKIGTITDTPDYLVYSIFGYIWPE